MSGPIHGKGDDSGDIQSVSVTTNGLHVNSFVWDVDTLSWIKDIGAEGAGGGGGGGSVTVTNFPAVQTVDTGFVQPLTDAELRASSLPLPTGAATEATLSSVDGKLPSLSGGRIPVVLPAGGGGLTDAELRASEVPVQDSSAGNLLWRILNVLMSPFGYDKSLQRYRQTAIVESGTVTTVGTLTNQTNIGGFNADAHVRASINAAWNLNVRSRIT
jgi:hypothetical protein